MFTSNAKNNVITAECEIFEVTDKYNYTWVKNEG